MGKGASLAGRVLPGVPLILLLLLSSSCKGKPSAPESCPLSIPRALFSTNPSSPPLRVFALGVTVDLTRLRDREGFRSLFLDEIESLKPCFREDGVNLIVYPEDIGLLAGLVGPRGEIARGVTRSEDAFISIGLAYGNALGYYQRKFPWITQNQALLLALSSTVWGLTLDTFGEVARRARSYVVVSINAPYPFEESDETSAPPPLTYPELGLGKAYSAVTSDVYNLSVFFSPRGERLGVDPKRYLVPAEEDLLQLSYGSLADIALFDLGGIRVGSVISKDAWMPDVLERLSDLGAQYLVQPEAFSGWTISETTESEWLPEVFMESGYLATQLYPGVLGVAVPMLIGNFFDLVFDGQSHLTRKLSPNDPPLGFVGNPPLPGFLSIGPWSFEDPGMENPNLSLTERRQILREKGNLLLPFSGNPLSGNYKNSRAVAEYSWGASEGVDAVRHPRGVDLGEKGVFVVYERFLDMPSIRYGILDSRGEFAEKDTISTPGVPAYRPVLAVTSAGISVLFSQGERGKERIYEVLFPRENLIPTNPIRVISGEGYQWWPSVTAEGDRLYLAWADGREGCSRIYFARKIQGVWELPRPVDGKNPSDLRGPRCNSFMPAIAVAQGRVAIAFSDFRRYSWDPYLVFSQDGGEHVSPPVPLNTNAPQDLERIARWVSLRFTPETPPRLKILWNEIRARKPDPDLYTITTTDGVSFSLETTLPGDPSIVSIEGRAEILPLSFDRTLLAWEEISSSGFRIRIEVQDPSSPRKEEILSQEALPLAFPSLVPLSQGVLLLYTEKEPSGRWRLSYKRF